MRISRLFLLFFSHWLFKVFDNPLSSYKLKKVLKDIAATFGLEDGGTAAKLMGGIKGHMDQNPSLAEQRYFAKSFVVNPSDSLPPIPTLGSTSQCPVW